MTFTKQPRHPRIQPVNSSKWPLSMTSLFYRNFRIFYFRGTNVVTLWPHPYDLPVASKNTTMSTAPDANTLITAKGGWSPCHKVFGFSLHSWSPTQLLKVPSCCMLLVCSSLSLQRTMQHHGYHSRHQKTNAHGNKTTNHGSILQWNFCVRYSLSSIFYT